MPEGDMRLAVAGAAGRMGRSLIALIADTPGVALAVAMEHAGSKYIGQEAGVLAGIAPLGIQLTADLGMLAEVEGVIDFTVPSASLDLARYCARYKRAHVIGTTGFSADQIQQIEDCGGQTTIIRSGNMSLGVNLLAALVQQAAAALGTHYDVEIVEMHHRHKVDAPSGTALLLGEAAAAGRDISLAEHMIAARHGHTGQRDPGDIGFASLRGGSVIGDHMVIMAGPNERIELAHRAESREIFAAGAIRAAQWARGKPPGLYTMRDVLGIALP